MQLIFTPHCIYKWFRNLVIGYTSGGADTPYILKTIGNTVVKNLTYFKVGNGGPNTELTRTWFDANIKDNGAIPGNGDLHSPLMIKSTNPDPYAKDLTKDNFPDYATSDDSKVAGVLSIVSNGTTDWWDIPGIAFQVQCHLTPGEANPGEGGVNPDPVFINEIGVFDDDDILCLYGVFDAKKKVATQSLKMNLVAMLKTLDYQLVLLSTTTTTTTTVTTTSTTTLL